MAYYPDGALAAKFNCGTYVTIEDVTAFDPSGFTIALWLMWRDPNFKDPCFVANPGEDPIFTTSADTAWVFAYNDYQDPFRHDGTARLTLSVPAGLTLWNSSSSLESGLVINDRQWHFLVISSVPADACHALITIWLDGEQKLQQTLYHDEGFATPDGKKLGLGCEYANGYPDNLFCGAMGAFQMWRGALDAKRIRELMSEPPVPGQDPNLLVLLDLTDKAMKARAVTDLVGKHTGRIAVVGA